MKSHSDQELNSHREEAAQRQIILSRAFRGERWGLMPAIRKIHSL